MPLINVIPKGLIQAVLYNGSSTQAAAIQAWVNTGDYNEPGIYTRDYNPMMLYQKDNSALLVKPDTYVIRHVFEDEVGFDLISKEEFDELFTEEIGKSQITVQDYLNTYFDSMDHELLEQPEYKVGSILHTANSRVWTNATITEVKDNYYRILTDIGNELIVTQEEIESRYLKPIISRKPLVSIIPNY